MCFAPQQRALFRHLNVKKWSEHGVFCTLCFAPQRRALFRHLNFQKWSEPGVFVHFDLEMCVVPHRRALFRHPTSKSGPDLVCFVHFDLEMCFAPQRRALFRHLNFQKWSECEVSLAFLLGNALCATTAFNFSSLIWPAGFAPAALARLLFDPPEPQIIGKTEWIATFLPFRAPASSLFWFSPSLIVSLLDFSSLTLPTAFPSLQAVGSLTSKLPSRTSYLGQAEYDGKSLWNDFPSRGKSGSVLGLDTWLDRYSGFSLVSLVPDRWLQVSDGHIFLRMGLGIQLDLHGASWRNEAVMFFEKQVTVQFMVCFVLIHGMTSLI